MVSHENDFKVSYVTDYAGSDAIEVVFGYGVPATEAVRKPGEHLPNLFVDSGKVVSLSGEVLM